MRQPPLVAGAARRYCDLNTRRIPAFVLESNPMVTTVKNASYFTPCVMCDEITQKGRATTVDGWVVCDQCAAHIANTWWYAHSGEYLTWPNPRPLKEKGYKKRVIGQALRTEVFERDAYRCRHCGGHRDLRADHIVPESKGGPTILGNLQTLCAKCNSRKGVQE